MLRVVLPGLQSFVGLETHDGQTYSIRGGVIVDRDQPWRLERKSDHALERLLPLNRVDIRAKPEFEQRDHHFTAYLPADAAVSLECLTLSGRGRLRHNAPFCRV